MEVSVRGRGACWFGFLISACGSVLLKGEVVPRNYNTVSSTSPNLGFVLSIVFFSFAFFLIPVFFFGENETRPPKKKLHM